MYIRTLQLTNYRNFRRLALALSDGPTVICAPNAQGKSNLLEAIELLATTKSARAGSERELIHWEAIRAATSGDDPLGAFARVSATIVHQRGEMHADIVVRAGDLTDSTASASKSFRLNGLPRRAVEFVGEINVVAFSPEDVGLVAGAPSGRRRYLDVTNAQMSGRYLRALQRYNKVLAQRNHLLRESRERGRADPSLAVWDAELAQNGAFLFQERARSVRALSSAANRWFRELAGWGQELQILYKPGLDETATRVLVDIVEQADDSLGAIHGAFAEAIERSAARERGAGMSLMGPHRDDVSFLVDGVDLNVFGSRGQQRIAVLSLKLAELDVLESRVGSRPILLLDDALSELDEVKQAAVLRVARDCGQSVLTTARLEPATFRELGHPPVLQVRDGAILEPDHEETPRVE